MRKLIVASAVLLIACTSLARDRAAGRNRFTPASAEAFNPSVAVLPSIGWSVLATVNGGEFNPENPVLTLPSSIAVTVRTWGASAAPWSDGSWLASNPRYLGGSFEVPVYRVRPRAGALPTWCRIATLHLIAAPDQFASVALDPTQFQMTDIIYFETWKGFSTTLEVAHPTSQPFAGVVNNYMATYPEAWLVTFGPQHQQPAWSQTPIQMGCE